MSDIYLQITETPTVVTLSQPVIGSSVAATVTVANTVTVALDANSLSALENVTVTVGAAITGTVTVSNFPAFPTTQAVTFSDASLTNTQLRASAVTIGGTVTANLSAIYAGEAPFSQSDNPMIAVGGLLSGFNEIRPITIDLNSGGQIVAGTVTANLDPNSFVISSQIESGIGSYAADLANDPFPISGTVTANAIGTRSFVDGNAVTVSGFLGIGGWDTINSQYAPLPLTDSGTGLLVGYDHNSGSPFPISGTVTIGSALPAGTNRIGVVTIGGGTVTIGAGTAQIGSVTAGIGLNSVGPSVLADSGFSLITRGMMVVGGISTNDVGSDNEYRELKITSTGEALVRGSVTASISGTVPVSISSVTVGNSVTIGSFATSVTARLINPAGTAVTYAEVGTAGSPSIDVLSIQGVTSGSPVPISISSVTIGSLPAISGTVTANPSISSTAITSGSFTSLTSATLVPANTARKMATVYNLGAGQLFVNAGVTATTLGGGFMVALSSGDFYECDYTTTTLSAIFATAGTASWVSH